MTNESAINKISKDKLEKLVKESTTWMDVMKYFRDNHGYKNITGNKTVKNRCIKENISFAHFNKGKTKVVLGKINKSYCSNQLKKRLIKEGKLEEKCTGCGIGNVYNNKPIVLHLEHINGDHYDNNIENLTVLCPNCHSQTDTWCGRNIKQNKKCLDCDKKIQETSTRCISCSIKNRHSLKQKKEEVDDEDEDEDEDKEKVEFEEEWATDAEDEEKKVNECVDCSKEIRKESTRCGPCASIFSGFSARKVPNRPSLKQLEEDKKTMSMVAMGKKYGVSDNAVKKWIIKYREELEEK